MEQIEDIQKAEDKVADDVNRLLIKVRGLVANHPKSPAQGIALLSELRDAAYENLNQIPHEYSILRAAKWLLRCQQVSCQARWYWHPRQTGGAGEPDLRAIENDKIVVSAEITTSRRPVGTIEKRMNRTLAKLNGFEGAKFYFVTTEEMRTKADEVVQAMHQNITVVCFGRTADDL